MLRNFSFLMAGLALVVTPIGSAYAQVVPGASVPQTNGVSAVPRSNDPGVVMLADIVPQGEAPRAARPDTIAGDTPVISRAEFLRRYPQSDDPVLRPYTGPTGYSRIVNENVRLCDYGREMLEGLLILDQGFTSDGEAYRHLEEIFEGLPRSIRRAANIMTVAQAAQTGALCLLTAGLYCIAAIAGGIGNIFTGRSSAKLQLANIRLSLANILVARRNIASNRWTLRANAFWLDLVVPYCEQIYPGSTASAAGSFSAALPRVDYRVEHPGSIGADARTRVR